MSKANIKTQPLTKTLLYLLFQAGKTVIDAATIAQDISRWHTAYLQGGLSYVRLRKQLAQQHLVRAALYNLKYKRYLTAHKIGKRLIVSLTYKGQRALIKERLRQAPTHSRGFYTVVIFDIPETEATTRRQFRWLLRESGFTKLQQSVWVSNRDIWEPLTQFIQQVNIEQWVNVLRVDKFLSPPRLRNN
ncbi:MAG: CRISPR-associated endonuclease Cas2 [Patescibacteria group bacterium]